MKISEALKERKDLTIPFGSGAVLQVTYQPSSVTIADIEALKADRDIKRVAEQIRQQVLQWDLTDDYDRIIPLAPPQPRIITQDGDPIEPGAPTVTEPQKDPLHEVPIHILSKILIAIQTDQRPDPEA
jgi:hypothetical protein